MLYEDGRHETYTNYRLRAIDGSVTTLPNTGRCKKRGAWSIKLYRSMQSNIKYLSYFILINPLDQMEKLFLTNTIVIRANRKSKSRLDKDIYKSTIATH